MLPHNKPSNQVRISDHNKRSEVKLFCSEKRNLLILCLAWAVCYLPVCWFRPLVMPDETRYAEIAREMVHGQSWIVPHLDGLLYFEKPVFGYWLNSLSLLLLGENAFAIRFPSALSVLITALAIYVLIRREQSEPDCAMTGSLLYLSTLGVWGIGVSAVLDNPFSLFCTLSLISFYWASQAKRWSRQEWFFLALSGIFCGLGLLTKGFVVLPVIAMAVTPYLIIRKRYADLFRMAWFPAIMATLVTLPWG
ncbi:MAG: phospholipid carrier-dependent glycosyltransferase, partial [Lentisphaerae bacterium]